MSKLINFFKKKKDDITKDIEVNYDKGVDAVAKKAGGTMSASETSPKQIKGQLFLGVADGTQYKNTLYDSTKPHPTNSEQEAGRSKLGSFLKNAAKGAVSVVGNKIEQEAKNYVDDLSLSLKDLKDGSLATLKDMIAGAGRSGQNDPTYSYKEYSIANRHKDAISGVLNNVLDGNLLDVGLSVLRLHNNGTKFNFARAQDVDKDLFHFKYWYYGLEESNTTTGIWRKANENREKKEKLMMLDSIEDPTLLGYTLRIDNNISPLFVKDNSQLIRFIDTYQQSYPELTYAKAYLEEFREDILKIFLPPSSKTENNTQYAAEYAKNHYITSISGLDELDNLFANYSSNANEQQALKITLHEDVRMFTNRLAFLYRNLTYSYNMGKKLIPENLLRFNLYIKIADYRNFTSSGDFGDKVRDNYSRVIYELKDCEFVFDKSMNPATITLGGFEGVNNSYSNLEIKIKYRKVNRIFYSTMFSAGLEPFLIGDRSFATNIDDAHALLNQSKLLNETEKRKATSNNISVSPSIQERYNDLKNNGLLREDDNDSAVGRFLKKATNNVTKAAFQPIDEGLKKVTNKLNNTKLIGEKSFIRTALNAAIGNKVAMQIGDRKSGTVGKMGSINPKPNTTITDPNKKLHPKIVAKNEIAKSDLHEDVNQEVSIPKGDLHNDVVAEPIKPMGAVHIAEEYTVRVPSGDLHEELNKPVEQPSGDLHDTVDADIEISSDALHGSLNHVISNPNDALHEDVKHVVEKPNRNIDMTSESSINIISGNVTDTVEHEIKSPKSDVSNDNHDIKQPNENVYQNIDRGIKEPSDDKHPDVEHKIQQSDKYNNLKEFIKKRPKGK